MKEHKNIEETIEYLDNIIQYAECLKTHLTACRQIEWERDAAIQRLENIGRKEN